MPFFGQETLIESERKGPLTSPDYKKAIEKNHRLARELGIDEVMAKYKLDALVAPSMFPANLIDPIVGDSVPFTALSSSSPMSVAAVAGYPHVTVPLGQVRGLPVGISFFGRAWSEARLLGLAYAFEQAHPARKPSARSGGAPRELRRFPSLPRARPGPARGRPRSAPGRGTPPAPEFRRSSPAS
jgi:amidase